MATYKIIVKNQSGAPQYYNFFNQTPRTAPGSTAAFEVDTKYFAICGSSEGSPGSGGRVSITKTVPIKLGELSDGKVTMGSTVQLSVFDKNSCDIGMPVTPGRGKEANFEIDTSVKTGTGQGFTLNDAITNNLLIGIASSQDGDISTAMATFAPGPNTQYQIQPQAIYHVAAGSSFQVGQLVKVEAISGNLAVDFAGLKKNEVVVIHDSSNTFSFAT